MRVRCVHRVRDQSTAPGSNCSTCVRERERETVSETEGELRLCLEMPHAAVSPRPPNSSHAMVARAEGYAHAAKSMGVVPHSRAIFCLPRAKPVLTLMLRFATFPSL
jgi:hypothetical protein